MNEIVTITRRNLLGILFSSCILLLIMAHYTNDTVNITHPRFMFGRIILSMIALVILSALPVLTKCRGEFKFARNMSWFWLTSTILMMLALPERDSWCPELTSMHEPLGIIIVVVGFTFFALLFPITAMLIDPYDVLSRSTVLEWHILFFLAFSLLQLGSYLWIELNINDVKNISQLKSYLKNNWNSTWSWTVADEDN